MKAMSHKSELFIVNADELREMFENLKKCIEEKFDTITTTQPTELLTIKEAAEYLGITDTTLRNLTNNGDIKGYRIRGRKLYKRHELEKALKPIRCN